jgi:hypothetical protein
MPVPAVELFVEVDEAALYAEWEARIDTMSAAADGVRVESLHSAACAPLVQLQ